MRTPTALILALSTTLAACGGGDPKESAYQALNSGDYAAAAADFEKAMAGVDAGSADYVGLAVGRCEALAHTDAPAAKNEMIALAGSHEGKVSSKDYTLVASKMVDARNFVPAIELLDDGIKNRFKDDPKLLALMDKIKAEAEKSGDDGAMEALSGLGYAGGD